MAKYIHLVYWNGPLLRFLHDTSSPQILPGGEILRVGLRDGMEDFSPVHCGYETSFDQPDSKKQK